MSNDFSFNDDDLENFSEGGGNPFIVLDSIMFLVDGTEQMFKENYFSKCLEVYRNIVRKKGFRDRKDKVGLTIFGTKESNCQVNNLMEIQKFDTITVDTLKNINDILKESNDKYKRLSSDSKYSLYEALLYAYQTTGSFKTKSKKRSIIFLCTCNDNPCHDKPDEQRRINHLVKTFKESQTELWVAGLSESWNDELYYKDLQIISGTFTNDNYKRFHLNDIEQRISNPSRSICKLQWKISSQIAIDVNLLNLVSPPQYPFKTKLEKKDNGDLVARQVINEDNVNDESDDIVEEETTRNTIIRNEDIRYYKNFCGLDVSFKPAEHMKFRNMNLEPGIEILAFKPISCDPINHLTYPYFVLYTPNCSEESKNFFMAFVSKCAEKKVMAICKVVTKVTIFICTMIPSEDDGGFYLYRIPFSGCVRDLDKLLQPFIFNSENPCPVNDTAVDIFKNLMNAYKVDFDLRKFTNPKLEKCMAHIEALALDERLGELPPDKTLPPPIATDVQYLIQKVIRILDLPEPGSSRKRGTQAEKRMNKKPKLDIVELARKKMLNKATIPELKAYLDSVNRKYTGTKTALINSINEHLGIK